MITNFNIINIILDYFDNFSTEKGGALAISENAIVDFYPIRNMDSKSNCYLPSFDELNLALESFEEKGFSFAGIIHSHTNGNNKPSKQDIEFFKSFRKVNKQFGDLLFPIICLKNGKKDIAWYLVNDKEITKVDVKTEL